MQITKAKLIWYWIKHDNTTKARSRTTGTTRSRAGGDEDGDDKDEEDNSKEEEDEEEEANSKVGDDNHNEDIEDKGKDDGQGGMGQWEGKTDMIEVKYVFHLSPVLSIAARDTSRDTYPCRLSLINVNILP